MINLNNKIYFYKTHDHIKLTQRFNYLYLLDQIIGLMNILIQQIKYFKQLNYSQYSYHFSRNYIIKNVGLTTICCQRISISFERQKNLSFLSIIIEKTMNHTTINMKACIFTLKLFATIFMPFLTTIWIYFMQISFSNKKEIYFIIEIIKRLWKTQWKNFPWKTKTYHILYQLLLKKTVIPIKAIIYLPIKRIFVCNFQW